MATAELKIDTIIKGSFAKGLKNVLPITVNTILWALTIWIPYLNIGTTIGLFTLPAKMAKGAAISMAEIFDPIYRKRMGEYFLATALVSLGVSVALMFLVIPGYVLMLAWGLAGLLVVDKEMNPMEAINHSNTITYGKKATIFFSSILLGLILVALLGLFALLVWALLDTLKNNTFVTVLMGLLGLVVVAFVGSIGMGATATVYGELTK